MKLSDVLSFFNKDIFINDVLTDMQKIVWLQANFITNTTISLSSKINYSFTMARTPKSIFDFINPVNLSKNLMQLFFNQDKKICEWSDFACHRETFSEKIQETCAQDEGFSNYLRCILESGIDYISQYDIKEILNDIRQELPENIVPYLAITSVAATGLFISAKHIMNNKSNPINAEENGIPAQRQRLN